MSSYLFMRFFSSKADLSASLHQMERECQEHIRSPLQKEILLTYTKSFCLAMAKYIILWQRKEICLFVSELIFIWSRLESEVVPWAHLKSQVGINVTQCWNIVKLIQFSVCLQIWQAGNLHTFSKEFSKK